MQLVHYKTTSLREFSMATVIGHVQPCWLGSVACTKGHVSSRTFSMFMRQSESHFTSRTAGSKTVIAIYVSTALTPVTVDRPLRLWQNLFVYVVDTACRQTQRIRTECGVSRSTLM